MPWWVQAFRFIGIGWYIGISIVGGIVAGVYLDRWLETKPLFVLVGLLLGLAVAGYGTYRLLQPFLAESRPPGTKGK